MPRVLRVLYLLATETSPQRSPLTELEGQTWACAPAGNQGNASFQMGRIGEVADPATPVWKGNTRVCMPLPGNLARSQEALGAAMCAFVHAQRRCMCAHTRAPRTAQQDCRQCRARGTAGKSVQATMVLQVKFDVDGAGAQTMPALPRNLPRVLGPPAPGEDLFSGPSTPKTAPKPFVPTTPSKSRPAKTPVTVAAFRKRRSQLAASAFAECVLCGISLAIVILSACHQNLKAAWRGLRGSTCLSGCMTPFRKVLCMQRCRKILHCHGLQVQHKGVHGPFTSRPGDWLERAPQDHGRHHALPEGGVCCARCWPEVSAHPPPRKMAWHGNA